MPDDSGLYHLGFLDVESHSHKVRALTASVGVVLCCVAPAQGLRSVCWPRGYISACKAAGLALLRDDGHGPLLPCPDGLGRSTQEHMENGKWELG